jgi:hypothetical protein
MKWFKHQTDASDDIKIKRLEADFQSDGYACFFKTIEKVGKEGKNYQLDTKKYPFELLAKDFNISLDRLTKIYEKMGELTLMDKMKLKKGILSFPNMRRYADEYTEKKERISRQGRESVGVEEKRLDKIRIEESIPSFKKPFYNGMPIRESKGKLWCIPKDGGEWLEFAGKNKDIKWQ